MIQKLHTLGLLTGSFLPDLQTEYLRSNLIQTTSKESKRMGQNMRLMNLRLNVVVKDIVGLTGLKIIEKICDGENNGEKLAKLRHGNCKKSKEEIAKALQNNNRQDYLFVLKQELHKYQDPQKLLYKALEIKKKYSPKGSLFSIKRTQVVQLLEDLLNKPPDKKHKELYTFFKRMCRERKHLFTFLFLKEVPADNNASERAIRNVKVKQKISGQFKTVKNAQNFAKIRSIIDTTLKNRMNVLQAMNLIAKLQINHTS